MKTPRSSFVPSNRRASFTRLGFACLTAAALSFVGGQNARAVVETWTGAASTDFSAAGNYSLATAPAGNTILFGTNAATVPNQPTTFSTISILQLGFQGAGWTIGSAGTVGQTLTLSGAATALPGVGTGTYVLGSTGAGTNTINARVTLSSSGAAFVDSGNALVVNGLLTSTPAFALSGAGTLTAAAGYTGSNTTTVGLNTIPGAGSGTTFNVNGGAFASTGALTVGAGSTLNVGGTATSFSATTLTVQSGATLSLANSGSTTFTTASIAGGKLVFDNSTTVVNRVPGTTSTNAITLIGGELQVIGNATAPTSQSAFLVLGGGGGPNYSASTITLTPSGTTAGVTLTDTGTTLPVPSATLGATLLIRGTNLGASTGAFSNFLVTGTTPVAVSGLIPYAIGDTTGTGQGNTFLTYNGTTGFVPAVQTTETIAAAATADNVVQTASDNSGTKTINSLLVNGGGLTTTLTGTLTLASGDFLATSGATGNTLSGGILTAPASTRLYLFVEKGATTGADLTVNSTLATANLGLTKSGAGTMLLNTAVSGTGNIDVAQGTLQLGGANVLGTNNSANVVYIGNNGTFDLNGFNITQSTTASIGNSNNQQNQSGTITNNSATASTLTTNASGAIYEHIAGNLAVTINGGTLNLGVFAAPGSPLSNTYTGNTTINTGGILTAVDTTLGAYSNTLVLNGGTFNPSNNGTFSASRNISVTATGGTVVADANGTAGFTNTYSGTIAAPAGTPTLTLQGGGAAGAKAGFSSVLVFASPSANALASNLNVVLNSATTTTPLTATFAASQSFGSLGSGTGAFGANTVLNANATGVVFTTGGNNLPTSYNGAITNGTGTSVSLVKNGTGTLSLTGANSYSGGTTINAGSILLTGGSAASFTASGTTVASSNAVTSSGTTAVVFGQTVTGTAGIPAGAYVTSGTTAASFTINANGSVASPTLTFGAYSGLGTGAITVSGGSLSLGSANALQFNTSLLTVNGGTLTSMVTATQLGGNLTMSSGAITPNGGSIGMLTLSANRSFTMSGGTLGLTIASTSSFDQITGSGTGTFTLSGGTLDLGGVTATAGSSYQILSGFASGSVSGIGFTDFAAGDGSTPSLSNTGVLSFTAVPEPSTWVAGVGLCLMLVGWSVRRRRA